MYTASRFASANVRNRLFPRLTRNGRLLPCGLIGELFQRSPLAWSRASPNRLNALIVAAAFCRVASLYAEEVGDAPALAGYRPAFDKRARCKIRASDLVIFPLKPRVPAQHMTSQFDQFSDIEALLTRMVEYAPPVFTWSNDKKPVLVANHWTAVLAQLVSPATMVACRLQCQLPSSSVGPYALSWWTNELLQPWIDRCRDLVITNAGSIAEAAWLTGVGTSRASEIRGQARDR